MNLGVHVTVSLHDDKVDGRGHVVTLQEYADQLGFTPVAADFDNESGTIFVRITESFCGWKVGDILGMDSTWVMETEAVIAEAPELELS